MSMADSVIELLRCQNCRDFPTPPHLGDWAFQKEFFDSHKHLIVERFKPLPEDFMRAMREYVATKGCGRTCHCGERHEIDFPAIYQLPPRLLSEIIIDLRTLRDQVKTDPSIVKRYPGFEDACDLIGFEAYRAGALANDRLFSFVVEEWSTEVVDGEGGPDHRFFFGGLSRNWIPVVIPGRARPEGPTPIDWATVLSDFMRLLQGPGGAHIFQDEDPPPSPAQHSMDFRCVTWLGEKYTFSQMQAACVKVMWEAWENDTPSLGQQTILESAESSSERLIHVFRNGKHPAWGSMIVPDGKGIFRLSGPK